MEKAIKRGVDVEGKRSKQNQKEKRNSNAESSEGDKSDPVANNTPTVHRWEEPSDCLSAGDECKVDTCLLHNRAPVLLSVYEQDLKKAAADATSRAVAEARTLQSPSPPAESQEPTDRSTSLEDCSS